VATLAKLRSVLVDVLNGDTERPCLLGEPCPSIHLFVQMVNVLNEDEKVRELSCQMMGMEVGEEPVGPKEPPEPFRHSPVVMNLIAPEVVEKARVAAVAKAAEESVSILEGAKHTENQPSGSSNPKVLSPKTGGTRVVH